MKLHTFFRSGTCHRLRIALGLKRLEVEHITVNLRTGEHQSAAFKQFNPQGLVPVLEHEDRMFIQSPAIIEWLEERYPQPPLLPLDPEERAHVRALAAIVGCDVHPINNKRILDYLRANLGCNDHAINSWCATWIGAGFDAIEEMLATDPRRGRFCFGNAPTLADVYLVPQVESARRFGVNPADWPHIHAVSDACAEIDAFRLAMPSLQPDAI